MLATEYRAELVLDVKNSTGECPFWNEQEQSLYWVDIPQRKLYRFIPAQNRLNQWVAPEMLGCIVPSCDGVHWLAAAQSGMFVLHPANDLTVGFHRIASIDHPLEGMRFNDGRCDRQGRFIAGTMVMNPPEPQCVGKIYQLQGDGSLLTLLEGFVTPNGMAFSPDGKKMYLSDSSASVRQVWAFDYDVETGTPSNQRGFLNMAEFEGRPDGAAIDTDGCYWICGIDAGCVHRYTPDGRLVGKVRVPVAKPTMCAFGDEDLRTLYVTSIRPNATPDSGSLDGGLFAARVVDAQGMPEARCATH